jgi:hypothetical protein
MLPLLDAVGIPRLVVSGFYRRLFSGVHGHSPSRYGGAPSRCVVFFSNSDHPLLPLDLHR